jgi:hypothetical protein
MVRSTLLAPEAPGYRIVGVAAGRSTMPPGKSSATNTHSRDASAASSPGKVAVGVDEAAR